MAIKETSDQLCKRIAEKSGGECIISFSLGKDSIAAYVQAKKYFKKVHLVYYYLMKDIEFIQRSVKYYEDKFQQKIWQYPSGASYRMLNELLYQPPERIDTIWDFNIFVPTNDQIFEAAKLDIGVAEDCYVGIGVRKNDSLTRRLTIDKYGAENLKRNTFFPVFDWSISDIEQALKENDIKLPIDYKIWGRTFDGIQLSFLEGVREYFPKDYERIMEIFPLAEMDFLRYRDFAGYNPFNV